MFEGDIFTDAKLGNKLVGFLNELELFLRVAVPQQFNIGETGADTLLAAVEFERVEWFFISVDFVRGIEVEIAAEGRIFVEDIVYFLEGHHLFWILQNILEVLLGPERIIVIDPEGPEIKIVDLFMTLCKFYHTGLPFRIFLVLFNTGYRYARYSTIEYHDVSAISMRTFRSSGYF